VAETAIRVVPADGFVCHQGSSDDHWLGVLDGLVKMASVPLEGKSMSFVGVPTARWFGEGSLLKSEPRRYDGIALRDSSIAFMPRNTFALLLDSASTSEVSFGFSSSERLGDFFSMVKYERSLAPNASLAKRVGGAVQCGAVSG
jgi:CRP/FNR family cyclic AMP-dependent transcriptional regulator